MKMQMQPCSYLENSALGIYSFCCFYLLRWFHSRDSPGVCQVGNVPWSGQYSSNSKEYRVWHRCRQWCQLPHRGRVYRTPGRWDRKTVCGSEPEEGLLGLESMRFGIDYCTTSLFVYYDYDSLSWIFKPRNLLLGTVPCVLKWPAIKK